MGVDAVAEKVDLVNRGLSTIIEAEIAEITASATKAGRLGATDDQNEAISQTELSFICVGTPSQPNGNLNLKYIRRICEQIGEALKHKTERHTVVIRSTVLPGTMRRVVIPILEEFSGKRAGADVGVCHKPEVFREGSGGKEIKFSF